MAAAKDRSDDRPAADDARRRRRSDRRCAPWPSDIEWPSPSPGGGPDLATRVRARLPLTPPRADRGGGPLAARSSWRSRRSSSLVAIAAAVGLGLPGPAHHVRTATCRSLRGPATTEPSGPASPSATRAPRRAIRAGTWASASCRRSPMPELPSGDAVVVPTDPIVGPPDAVYVDASRGNQVAEVWRSGGRLPPSLEPSVGLLLMSCSDGTTDGYYEKMLGSDTVIVPDQGRWSSPATGSPARRTSSSTCDLTARRSTMGAAGCRRRTHLVGWHHDVPPRVGSLGRATMIRIAELLALACRTGNRLASARCITAMRKPTTRHPPWLFAADASRWLTRLLGGVLLAERHDKPAIEPSPSTSAGLRRQARSLVAAERMRHRPR